MKNNYFFLLILSICQLSLSIVEKKIVVIIPSYNNETYVEKNITSALSQTYENYEIIYINDASTDNTRILVEGLMKECDFSKRITLIDNPVRQGAMYNLYHAIHSCDDSAIIITLDGDDWFANQNVLNRINREYSTKDIWMTWGQYETSKGKRGCCESVPDEIIKKNSIRKYTKWVMSHPRTFYAKLFKKIQKEDFLYNQKFMDVSWDLAMMFPMLEMAGLHHSFIQDVLYIYNVENPINDNKIKLNRIFKINNFIRHKPKYTSLINLF